MLRWKKGLTADVKSMTGRSHFDLLDDLEGANGEVRRVLGIKEAKNGG